MGSYFPCNSKMSDALSSRKDQLRHSLVELLDKCPADCCNPIDCPLHKVRKMSRKRRLNWFNGLTSADLEYLASYHHTCMGLKLGGRPKANH